MTPRTRYSLAVAASLTWGMLHMISVEVTAGDHPPEAQAGKVEEQSLTVIGNAGFETDAGWSGLVIGDSACYAPVHGSRHAILEVQSEPLVQVTEVIVEPGTRYEVTVWARSIYDNAHTTRLAAATYRSLPIKGVGAKASANLSVIAAGTVLTETQVDVNPKALRGDATTVLGDDGANVWIDGDYRVQFSDSILYQSIDSDPITDQWRVLADDDYDQDMAVGVVKVPGGKKFILNCHDTDDPPRGEPWESLITLRAVGALQLGAGSHRPRDPGIRIM